MPVNEIDLTVQRVRHTLKLRKLHVLRTNQVTPRLLTVTLGGDDLHDFVSASFDDHVKLFFPEDGTTEVALPLSEASEHGSKPIARDYTPRRFDPEGGELDIEFVLHGDGPATTWATQARPGDILAVGGPRGSFVVPHGFDWMLLAGDETALPAIARRLEETPAGARIIVVLETESEADRITFTTQADAQVIWTLRNDEGNALESAIRQVELPPASSTQGFAWAAGEATAMRALHRYLTQEFGLDKSRIRASAYWKRGQIAVHETVDD